MNKIIEYVYISVTKIQEWIKTNFSKYKREITLIILGLICGLFIAVLLSCAPLTKWTTKDQKTTDTTEAFRIKAPEEKGLLTEYNELKGKTRLIREESFMFWLKGDKKKWRREYRVHKQTETEYEINIIDDIIVSILTEREKTKDTKMVPY